MRDATHLKSLRARRVSAPRWMVAVGLLLFICACQGLRAAEETPPLNRHGGPCVFALFWTESLTSKPRALHQPLLAGALTTELLVNHRFVLGSLFFPAMPVAGYPIQFLPDGKLVTDNLPLVTRWRLADPHRLELLYEDTAADAVAHTFVYDEGCGTLVSGRPVAGSLEWHGGRLHLEIALASKVPWR